MPTHRYGGEISLAAILAVKRSAGVAPGVNCRQPVTHMPLPSVSKAAYSGFEIQRRCHQKSDTGVSVPHKNDLCPPKKKKS